VSAEPTIAVVIPAFKGAHCIRAALDSVVMQSHAASEIIVIDDGSPDESGAIAASYGDRVQVIRQENGGTGRARNTGIRCATSDWIAFLDQDDTCQVDRLKRIREAALSSPSARWIYSDWTMLSTNTNTQTLITTPDPSTYGEEIRYACRLLPSCSAIRRDALIEIGGFSEQKELVGVDDHALALKFMRRYGSTAFVRVPEPLSVYTVHGTNFSRKIWDHYRGRVALLRYQLDGLTGVNRWIWKRILMARLHFDISVMLREQSALGYFHQSLRSLLQWPFPHRALPIRRYKVLAHMLLTRLGIAPLHKSGSENP
jgi:glycosyltransferase involved in cell wall biosynthesis